MDTLRAERFRRVAAPRVQRVVDSVDNLMKCANGNNYEYSDDDVRKMLRVIKDRVKVLEQRFGNSPDSGKSDAFTF